MNTDTRKNTVSTIEEPKTYWYFVSIQHFNQAGLGFSNFEMPISVRITTLDNIRSLERAIRNQGYDQAIVMGYHLLRVEPGPVTGARS